MAGDAFRYKTRDRLLVLAMAKILLLMAGELLQINLAR